MKFAIQVAGKTDVGIVRSNNEDNLGFDEDSGIYVVCDGMGGMAAGEKASKIAVDTVLGYFRRPHKGKLDTEEPRFEGVSARANALGHAIQLANQSILEEAGRDPANHGMGSTIVAVVIEGSEFSVGHVGDSRVYLLRNGSLQQLTNDHSWVMELVRRGMMTREQAEMSKEQNVILRSLGAEETVDPDLADHAIRPGDLLLLCSDGLSHFVKDEILREVLATKTVPQAACDALIEIAKASGSNDNITCLIVRAEEPSWGERLFGKFSSPKRQGSI